MATTTSSLTVDASVDNSDEPSYIDYETFLSPDFDPAAFANALVLSTNNPGDSPLDLSTPLSRVLFDAQELDGHIDLLTSRSALPLLEFTQTQTQASKRIVTELDTQLVSLKDSYAQLQREVIDKHLEAEQVRRVCLRLWETLRLGRSVGRCLQLGRQLEVQYSELGGLDAQAGHAALVRCSYTILSLREVIDSKAPGEEGHGLNGVEAIRSLQDGLITPIERSIRETAERLIRDFYVAKNMTFAQGEEARKTLESGLATLYLLSPSPPSTGAKSDRWVPRLLLQSLEGYIRAALQSSIASLSRSLGQLPSLDKALAEVAAKCQNIVSLEIILDSAQPPAHPFLASSDAPQKQSMLRPLLAHLETGSLASYFWRTMAGSVATRVQDIVARGGVVARTLKSNKTTVGEAIRQAVIRGGQRPSALSGVKSRGKPADGSWDREIAVMVGSVVNHLGR